MNRLVIAIVALVIAGYVLLSSVFIVNEREQALVMRFGEITREIQEPGLYFKVPTDFVETVMYIDKRLLRYDLERIRLQVSGGQFYIVDAFITYRITDPTRFRQTVLGSLQLAEQRIATRLESALRAVYGLREFDAALSEQRSEMMREASDLVASDMTELGIQVADVRILVTDLTPEVSQQTYERMQAERNAEAALIRARGQEQAQILRAIADRQAVEIVSAANRDSEIIRGEGDAEQNRLFAEAYSQDQSFFEFYRSMEAYRTALMDGNTTMVLSPESLFFRYFGSGGELPEFQTPTATPIDIGVEGLTEEPIDSTQIDDLLATDSLVSGEGADDLETQVQDLESLIESENLGPEVLEGTEAPATPAPLTDETAPVETDTAPVEEQAVPAQ
ncbi:protease modulator HflC [Pelagibacterium luteolum]|uniref:Membrane protease subunit HflC n=1 Tax=Pelagibacterium luteolum TaxID=440168 RepID=A0A1G7UHU6_9HYPH|nr:protease modulator HflC [Pelagibacterium luteolum]SDG47132.1 membrane protease subunit HflC [Pelagibacterium luteolum]